ncbi:hypothetical protein DFQ30_009756 [Apophysomyces sp. BC1015]|nr:hypothetical protein DFQ30_009756 [Apophysomyces sp. BC1015]
MFTWKYTQDILCANAHKLLDLWHSGQLQATMQDPHLLLELYRATDPILTALVIVAVFTTSHYILSELTRNYSQVDKAWSILPGLYAWHFFIHDYLLKNTINPRLLIASVLITLWGIRLTYNFARKGGYAWSGQDYRYPYILGKIGKIPMAILNFTTVAPFQNLLLLLIVTPLYFSNISSTDINRMDVIAVVSQLFFLFVEAVADEQQYVFQTQKYAMLECVGRSKLKGDYQRGFLSQSGLWKFSRHPNFFSEMGIWWSIYLFSVATVWEHASGWDLWLNWTIVGAFTLTMLFQGSTVLTEVSYKDNV